MDKVRQKMVKNKWFWVNKWFGDQERAGKFIKKDLCIKAIYRCTKTKLALHLFSPLICNQNI